MANLGKVGETLKSGLDELDLVIMDIQVTGFTEMLIEELCNARILKKYKYSEYSKRRQDLIISLVRRAFLRNHSWIQFDEGTEDRFKIPLLGDETIKKWGIEWKRGLP